MTELHDSGLLMAAGPPSLADLLSDPLRDALLVSRDRWRDMTSLATDLAFETDLEGRFVFLYPSSIVGWSADQLLGGSSDMLLAEPGDLAGFSPFRAASEVRNRRVWLRRPDGEPCWMSFTAAPLLDPDGEVKGVRGVARDATDCDRTEAAMTRELRRAELADQIVWYMRTEILAPRMMQKALLALVRTMGADGAMLVESANNTIVPAMTDDEAEAMMPELLQAVGGNVRAIRKLAVEHLRVGAGGPTMLASPEGHLCLLCATPTRFEGCPGLVLWRDVGGQPWDADDLTLLAATVGTLRVLLELNSIQQEMALQSRTDALTGLFNRRAFSEEVTRRLDRLERDRLPGSLMLVDIDNFRSLNDQCGSASGDEGLKIVTALLRDASRPGDIVGRLGGDEFAVWYDGMDHLAAAERAEDLRLKGPLALSRLSDRPLGLSLSIAIASRWPGSGLETDVLLQRADEAMLEAKRRGKGQWRVWLNDFGDTF